MLTSLPGIGPKTARRITFELKYKFWKFDKEELPLEWSAINYDAFYALKKLGFPPVIIRETINKVVSIDKSLDTEMIIKESLKLLGWTKIYILKHLYMKSIKNLVLKLFLLQDIWCQLVINQG